MTMSAPDDKISSNRRRLFKALSTAPVVMTLKPGAALANASAFQCAARLRSSPPLDWYREIPHGAVDLGDGIYTVGGFFFKKMRYWDKENDFKLNSTHGQNGGCPTAISSVPNIIVEDGTVFRGLDGAIVGNVRLRPSNTKRLQIRANADTDLSDDETCGSVGPAKEGLFSYVGFTGNMDSAWNESGFFPEHRISRVDGAGELQGMTDSCMHSFTRSRTGLLGG